MGLGSGASPLFGRNTQDHKANEEKTSQVAKETCGKMSPQTASSSSAETHNRSQGSNKFIQKEIYVHSHNKALSKRSRPISAKTLSEKHKSRLRSKASGENTRENRSRFRFRGKHSLCNKYPRPQSKKVKDQSSHK